MRDWSRGVPVLARFLALYYALTLRRHVRKTPGHFLRPWTLVVLRDASNLWPISASTFWERPAPKSKQNCRRFVRERTHSIATLQIQILFNNARWQWDYRRLRWRSGRITYLLVFVRAPCERRTAAGSAPKGRCVLQPEPSCPRFCPAPILSSGFFPEKTPH